MSKLVEAPMPCGGDPANTKCWFSPVESEKYRKYMWAAPFDARFAQQNQTRHCFQYYVDYHRCKNLKGDDYTPCDYFKKVYMDMCPAQWSSKWDDWISEGKFPFDFTK